MRRLWTLSCVALLLTIVVTPIARAGGGAGCGTSGRLAARNGDYDIDVIDASGGGQWRVAEAGLEAVSGSWTTDPSWSPDGKALAYGRNESALIATTVASVRIVSVDGYSPRSVVSIPVAGSITEVAWSPDGDRVAFVHWIRNYPAEVATWTPAGDEASVMVVNRDGSGLRVVAVGSGVIRGLSWAPNGKRLAFANGFIPSRVEVVDVDALPAVVRVASPADFSATWPVWSPDGSRLAFIATPLTSLLEPPHIWVGDALGRKPRKMPLATHDRPTWSPDSDWLAAGNADQEAAGIAAVRVADKGVRQITGVRYDGAAAWSPDGTRLAFIRNEYPELPRIWTVDIATGGARPISVSDYYSRPIWCPST